MTGSEPPPPAGEGLSLLKDFLQQVANINKLEIQKSFLSKWHITHWIDGSIDSNYQVFTNNNNKIKILYSL